MDKMVCGSVNGGIKHKFQGYPIFKEQYVKKVISLKDKKCFLVTCM